MLPVLLLKGADNDICVATFLNSADNATSQDEQLICFHLLCTGLLVANVCLACLKSLATPTMFMQRTEPGSVHICPGFAWVL